MRILVLGGTVFLGRHVVAEALARGHSVTLFTRGRHGAGLFPEAEHVRGDRADVSALTGAWDAAIDTSGYQPGPVAASGALDVGHYVFVSTVNVYPGWPEAPVDEDSPVHQGDEDEYGPRKAACERALEAARPGRFATVRAGLLCGPHDSVFRLPWWVDRIGRGGTVPAPGDPERRVQLIDARDLAAFLLRLAERGAAGAFNGTAPIGQATMREVLEAAVDATGSGAELRWVSDDALARANAEPWMELPLWTPAAGWPGTWQVGTSRARAAGLRCRPIAETVADVAAWLHAGGADELTDWNEATRPPAMSPEREAELLALA